MTPEIATYRRVRAAVVAAREQEAVTDLVGSTELNLPAAAAYAQDYVLLGSLHGVRIVPRVGRLEIGPERRSRQPRRSGRDRREDDKSGDLWAERRVGPDRRQNDERRAPFTQVWEASAS